MNKKAAAAAAITGTGGAGAAATAATLTSQNSHGTSQVEETEETVDTPTNTPPQTHPQPNSPNQQETQQQVTSGTSATPQPSKSSNPIDQLRNDAKSFLTNTKLRSSFATINIDSFSEGESIDKYSVTSEQLNGSTALFGGYNNGHYKNTESSLRIEVQRTTKNGKGKGELTGFGSYVHDNKGFITFNKATTSSVNGKKQLVLTGEIYFLEKNNNKGTVKYKKEVKDSDNKTLDVSNFNKYFPKPYGYTKAGGFDQFGYNNGGFMSGAQDINNICGENECEEGVSSGSNMEGKWSGGPGYDAKCNYGPQGYGCDRVYKGSGNADSVSDLQWYDYMYGNVGQTRLEDHLKHVYKGAGRRVK